jgi:hypothetical protein
MHSGARGSSLLGLWSALRTPLLLAAGWATLNNPAVLASLVVRHSQNAFHAFYCAPLHAFFPLLPSQHECFLYIPTALLAPANLASLLGYALGLMALLAIVRRLRDQGRLAWSDRALAWGAVGLAAAPWLILVNQGPRIRLVPVILLGTAALWMLIVLNVGLRRIERLASAPWAGRLAAWTFPVSDLLWFSAHRRRIAQASLGLAWIPGTCALAALAALWASQLPLAMGHLPMERLPIRVYDPHGVAPDGAALWYTDTVGFTAGLWRYEPVAGTARPTVRAEQLRAFAQHDGAVYVYDRFEPAVLKVRPGDRQPEWIAPLAPEAGAVDLVAARGIVAAVDREGYVAVFDDEGRLHAERRLDGGAWWPQLVAGGRLAVVSSDRFALRLLNADLTDAAAVPLPIPAAIRRLAGGAAAGAVPMLTATAYDPGRGVLYIATWWGQILRYQLEVGQWLAPWRIGPGGGTLAVDGERGLLLVYNPVRRWIRLLALDSGRAVGAAPAPGFGNALTLDPATHVAYLSARGAANTSIPRLGAVYRFDYGALTPPRGRL